jgi:hypothetical protein
MAHGEAFINAGQVILGGSPGGDGGVGEPVARSGGRGGAGGAFGGQDGKEPDPDLPGMQGGTGAVICTNGGIGVDGGGGGGLAGCLPFSTSPGDGGRGVAGLGGTGTAGPQGADGILSTTSAFRNDGIIQIGGDGGDGGDGGQGGSGGGGSGGDVREGKPGGGPGVGGPGGAPGPGGNGTVLVGLGGRFVNQANATVQVGRGSGGASGTLDVQYGGNLVNHGSIIVDNGDILFGKGASVTNTGSIEASGEDLLFSVQTTVVNDGEIIASLVVNDGHFSGSGRIEGDFENYNRFAPGSSIGAMVLDGNYDEYWRLRIVLGETQDSVAESSYVEVSGDVFLAALSVLAIDFLGDFDERDLKNGDFFDVVRYESLLTGEFSGIDDSEALLMSGLWELTYDVDLGDGKKSVRLSYVPEPSTGLLIALGLFAILRVERRVA